MSVASLVSLTQLINTHNSFVLIHRLAIFFVSAPTFPGVDQCFLHSSSSHSGTPLSNCLALIALYDAPSSLVHRLACCLALSIFRTMQLSLLRMSRSKAVFKKTRLSLV